MDWTAIGAIAGIISVVIAIWNKISIKKWLEEQRTQNRTYNHLSTYDRDILKALCDSDTTQVSGGYDDTGSPHISTTLECVPGAPIARRLKVSGHYLPILHHLAVHGFLKENTPLNTPLRYDLSKRHLKGYHLTPEGKQFIHKYAIGRHRIEKFIRRRFKGLCKHKYEERYCDTVGEDERGKLPNLLQGAVKLHSYDVTPLGADQRIRPSIYEYPPWARKGGVECMVEIPLLNLDVAENDQVFLAIYTSNRPRYLKFNPKVAESSGDYWIQAEVISIRENDYPVGTVMNLGNTKPYDPAPKIPRNRPRPTT